MQSEYILVGEITRPQGVHGEVRVRPYTDDPARFEELERAYIQRDGGYVVQGVEFVRLNDDAVIVRLDGVNDRDAAEAMRGTLLYVDRAHAVTLPDNADFICDLIGCEVSDDEGRAWGKITDVMTAAGNSVYVINGASGEVLVPALKSVVVESDTRAKRMVMNAARMREVAVFEDA